MTEWTTAELDAIGRAEELDIIAPHADGRPAAAVPIWVVRVGDELYIRSYWGVKAAWFKRAVAAGAAHIAAGGVSRDVIVEPATSAPQSAVDDQYRQKYARFGGSYVTPMTADSARAATLAIRPV